MFTADDYRTLHSIVFATDADGRPRYPGYRPEVVELPNGDGRADRDKRYAHVAYKYLQAYTDTMLDEALYLSTLLQRAHAEALRVARALGVPEAFMPDIRYGALRVLEYPPGATSARHTDFDLFTLLCYRDRPEGLVRYVSEGGPRIQTGGYFRDWLDAIAPGLHIGELGEIVGLGPATPHEVVAVHETVDVMNPVTGERCGVVWPAPQHSIVYFAIPDHAAVLPPNVACNLCEGSSPACPGQTVGRWLAERMARSRAPK